MFRLWRTSQSRRLSHELSNALATDGLPPGLDPATLEVVVQRGSYSGRRVRYFRVFDPVRAAERAVSVRAFSDLDVHAELIMGFGHIEQDGAVVLVRRDAMQAAATPSRSNAIRADHADDEQFVRPYVPQADEPSQARDQPS